MAPHKVDKVAGLLTAPNELNADPSNLLRANNVVIRTPGVVEPRRGFSQDVTASFTTPTSAVNSFAYWKSSLIAVNAAGQFSVVGGSALSTSTLPPPSGVYRQRAVSSNNNLYLLSELGEYYFESIPSEPKKSGFPQPPDVYATLVGSVAPAASGSWLPSDSAVAYRVVFGYYDANKNFKLSAPSGRYVVQNRTITGASVERVTASATVTVTATNHGFSVGDTFTLSPGNGTTAGLYAAGTYTILTVPTVNTFTYTGPAGNGTAITAALTGQTLSRGTRYVNLKIYPAQYELTTSYFYRVYRTDNVTPATIDPGDEMYLVYEKNFTSAELSARLISLDDKTTAMTSAVPLYSNPNTGSGIGSAKFRAPLSKDMSVWGGRMWYANTEQPHSLSTKLLGTGAPNGLQSGDKFYWPGGSYTFDGIEPGLPSQNIARAIQQIAQTVNASQYASASVYNYDLNAYALGNSGNSSSQLQLARQLFSTGAFTWYSDRPTAWAPNPGTVGSTATGTTVAAAAGTGFSTIGVTTSGAHGFVAGDYVILLSGLVDGAANAFRAGIYTVSTAPTATTFTYIQSGAAFTGTATTNGSYQKLTTTTTTLSDNNRQVAGLYYSELGEPEAVPLLNYILVGDSSAPIIRIFPQEDRLLVFKEDGLYSITGDVPFRVDIFDQTCILAAADSVISMNNQVYALTAKGVVRIDGGGVQVISKPIDNTIRELLKSSRLDYLRQLTWCASYESEQEYILAVPRPSDSAPTYSTLQLVFNAATGTWVTWDLQAAGGFVTPTAYSRSEKLWLGSNRVYNPLSVPPDAYVIWNERKALNGTDYADYSFTLTAGTATAHIAYTQVLGINTLRVELGDVLTTPAGAYGLVTEILEIGVSGSVALQLESVADEQDIIPFTTAATVTVYKAYDCDVQFVSAFASDPTDVKSFRECTAFLRSRKFYSANLSFVDAWSSTEEDVNVIFTDSALEVTYNTTTRVPPWNKRVLVPKDKQQTSYLNVGFNMKQARAYFALNGYSLVYELSGNRNSR